jgi:hypothetical protein
VNTEIGAVNAPVGPMNTAIGGVNAPIARP